MIIRVFFRSAQLFMKEEAAKLAGVEHNQTIKNEQRFYELKVLSNAFKNN
jgi:hypothetical protein